MPYIFSFFNYREYLGAWYDHKKRHNPAYSYQLLANKAGFRSKSFFPQVLRGTRGLSQESVFSLAKAMDLSGRRLQYFRALVEFNQARTNARKEHLFRELIALNSSVETSPLSQDQYDFFSHWYHATVRELVTRLDWDGNYALLAKMVRPAISPLQARESVRLLERLNLIEQVDGRWVQSEPCISASRTVRSLVVDEFQRQNLRVAIGSLSTSHEEREVSCLVAGLSPRMYEKVKHEIDEFRRRLTALAASDTRPQQVYHINLQIFPTSEPLDMP